MAYQIFSITYKTGVKQMLPYGLALVSCETEQEAKNILEEKLKGVGASILEVQKTKFSNAKKDLRMDFDVNFLEIYAA